MAIKYPALQEKYASPSLSIWRGLRGEKQWRHEMKTLETLILQELQAAQDAGDTPITQGALHRRFMDAYPCILTVTETLWQLAREKKIVWHSGTLSTQSRYSLPREAP